MTMDPFGHCVLEAFPEHFAKGYDIRPTIAGMFHRDAFVSLSGILMLLLCLHLDVQ